MTFVDRYLNQEINSADSVVDELDLAPAVCRAGYLQFSGDRSFTNTHVQSRGFFWCKSGKGKFYVNGEEFHLGSKDLYLLPWDRTIRYLPDRQDPMYTGHIHLVPFYREGSEWIPNVPHRKGDVAFNTKDRSDVDWPDLRGVVRFKIHANDEIALLMDYIIRCYQRNRGKDEQEARLLGRVLVNELMRLREENSKERTGYPEELIRLMAHIDSSYMRSVTVTDLAEVIDRSRSHVLKLFKHHLGISAKTYIIRKQLLEACELLVNTTKSIGEVGQAVGIPDPYHFSKLFRKHTNLSPTAFRSNHGPIDLSL